MREFGQLESAVMDVIWSDDQPLFVREVLERLDYDKPVAYTTVMTVLSILYGKGVLRREMYVRAWRYWPVETRAVHDARLMTEILRSSGDAGGTLRELVARSTAAELDEMRALLEERPQVREIAV